MCRLDCMGVQEVRWDTVLAEPAEYYIFVYSNGNVIMNRDRIFRT
jgi:hypothetical protein